MSSRVKNEAILKLNLLLPVSHFNSGRQARRGWAATQLHFTGQEGEIMTFMVRSSSWQRLHLPAPTEAPNPRGSKQSGANSTQSVVPGNKNDQGFQHTHTRAHAHTFFFFKATPPLDSSFRGTTKDWKPSLVTWPFSANIRLQALQIRSTMGDKVHNDTEFLPQVSAVLKSHSKSGSFQISQVALRFNT